MTEVLLCEEVLNVDSTELTGVNEDGINVDFGTDRTQDEAAGRAKHER